MNSSNEQNRRSFPRTQTEEDGPTKPPKTPKTALGLSEHSFEPGQTLNCKIKSKDSGGYKVEILPSGHPGFLPTKTKFDEGMTVKTIFITVMEEEKEGIALLVAQPEAVTLRRKGPGTVTK